MEATVELEHSPDSIAAGRHWAGDRAEEWGRPDIVDQLQLIVSELVTNAVVHAGTSCRLTLRVDGPTVTVEVTDESPEVPLPREYGIGDDLGGRGLHIVEAFTSSWGYRPTATGKTVWAEMDLSAT